MKFKENDTFFHAGQQGIVVSCEENYYNVLWGPVKLPMRLKESWMNEEDTHDYSFNKKQPNIIVCDDFYSNPDDVRELALEQEFFGDERYHKGKRTKNKFLFPYVKERLEEILGGRISNGWLNHACNGVFQYCPADTPIVYHSDLQSYAAVVYLTPDAPYEAGTSFFASKRVKGYRRPATPNEGISTAQAEEINNLIYNGNLLDKTAWELVDTVGNVYNRLAIWDSQMLHAASCYFGTELNNSRLFHMYFFDMD